MSEATDPLASIRLRVRSMGRDDAGAETGDEVTASDIMAELDQLELRIENSKRRVAIDTRRHLDDLAVIHNANRLATVGNLTVGMAHEFGTPLGVILARAQMVATDDVDIVDARKDATFIITEVKRMTRMCRDVLDYVRPVPPKKVLVDVAQLITQAIGLLSLDVRRRRVDLVFHEPATSLEVLGDASKLIQVLTNIIINAAQAMPGGGAVHVRAAVKSLHPPGVEGLVDGDFVCVDVEDTGVGIRNSDLEHLFDTFFTTRKEGEGTGLGLAVSRRIVREHDGWIGVVTAEGVGSTFTIHLPLKTTPH